MISDPSCLCRPLLAFLLAVALAACSVPPTPYQPEHDDGGYSDQQLESNRYRVKFAGNNVTPRETVENFALYRAAELTLQTGNDHFKVVSKDVEPVINSVRGSSPNIGIGVGSGGDFGFGVSTGLGGGRASYNYVSYLDIVVFDGDKPEDDQNVYAAWDVIDSLKSTIGPYVLIPTRPKDKEQK